jgi:hypothetical protein
VVLRYPFILRFITHSRSTHTHLLSCSLLRFRIAFTWCTAHFHMCAGHTGQHCRRTRSAVCRTPARPLPRVTQIHGPLRVSHSIFSYISSPHLIRTPYSGYTGKDQGSNGMYKHTASCTPSLHKTLSLCLVAPLPLCLTSAPHLHLPIPLCHPSLSVIPLPLSPPPHSNARASQKDDRNGDARTYRCAADGWSRIWVCSFARS